MKRLLGGHWEDLHISLFRQHSSFVLVLLKEE